MKSLIQFAAAAAFCLALCPVANADVWRWVDANGDSHFVDSNLAMYTWQDKQGKVYYSDKPDHEDAVRVQLMWHSKGSLAEAGKLSDDKQGEVVATAAETGTREAVVAKNCERAKQILSSYENAPKLYRTNEAGGREILDEAEFAATLADAKEKTKLLCSQ